MNKKLSWREIRKHFSGQWVELVDCDWDWKDAKPKSACVRNFSPNRKKLIGKDNKDSVILYVSNASSLLGLYNDSTGVDSIASAVGF